MNNLKHQIEAYGAELANLARKETGFRPYVTKRCYKEGFTACLELLWPVVVSIDGLDCICDAIFSGSNEAEYSARGCAACTCEHLQSIYNLKTKVGSGE